jgi:hypothetical protein
MDCNREKQKIEEVRKIMETCISDKIGRKGGGTSAASKNA